MQLKNWLKTLAISALATPALAQQAMSLNDCVAFAQTNHPQVKIAQLAVTDADWRLKENKATGLPQVTAGITYTGFIQRGGVPSSALSFGGSGTPPPDALKQAFIAKDLGDFFPWFGDQFKSDPNAKIYFGAVHSLSGKLELTQLLFSNSYLLAKKAAKYYTQYAAEGLNAARQQVKNGVADAYLPALLISENLAILDKNMANLEKILGETRAVNKAGFVEQLDVDRLELSLASLKTTRGNLARQREIVVNALKFVMGMPVAQDISLSDNLEKLLAEYGSADLTSPVNFQNRPEYQQLLRGRDLADIQVKLYEKPYLPTVAGFASYQPGYQGGFGASTSATHSNWYFIPSAVAGVSVSVPLYDGGLKNASRERAQVQMQTIDAQRGMLENAISLEVENARKLYLSAQERTASEQKNLDLAQRIYTTTQTKFKAGIGSSFEMTTAQQGVYSAQAAVMQAQYDLLAAKVAIKKALGN